MEADASRCSRDGVTGTIDLSGPTADLTGRLHHLPCCIKQTGPCSVSDYFKPKPAGVVIDGVVVEEAAFRGRKLDGATIPIPDGYCGFVLEKNSNKNISSGETNHWRAHSKFRNITYWNHDSLPSRDDEFMRLFHWFSVANALHNPVLTDELESSANVDESNLIS
ncbi:Ribonuclease H2 subunit C [Nymphaea thermarum]|nr:Ribonuclease H2 subunit C [Nymphaea thermarum]